MKKIDYLLAGVGGQGTILASRILASAGLELGYDVKTAEVHGMAQRGGSVESHVRWGEKVYSPLVEHGMADYLIGFEMVETARWLTYLNNNSVTFINRFRIPPLLVTLGKARYPSEKEIENLLQSRGGKVKWLSADDMAKDAGNPAMAGVVLLGALSNLVGGGQEIWLQVIKHLVPARFVEMNQKAFLAGRDAGRG
ncbi:MAG: indolepyruvate oxidoreductase subunit beta [Syntrophaceae bacterium]|nr:indolepyruvate oxidoreductase subunit beta [Pseudomonadota bacterium]MCG2741427.1 indolepyruvate oxidoreductase subunit beta [Syntrophaceae bacterium]